ncbi:hypothetical protein Pint_20663 [Pistacia integerrima]|uniref:Uncharacterized protein n=1 Tax=Pistacia integerrima TaxID=434235 RepID=A0ACC0XBB9_9ROSI|nr:hypothetical protein Pint_20663 [Pistacia integerrima]
MAMAIEGGRTLSEIYQSSKRALLRARDGVEKLERLEGSTSNGGYDSSGLSVAVKKDIAQIQSLCVEMDRLWRSIAAKKVEQVAEEAESLKESLDKYFLEIRGGRMKLERGQSCLEELYNGDSSHVLRIFKEEAQALLCSKFIEDVARIFCLFTEV